MNLTQFLVRTFKEHGPKRGPNFAHELVAESVGQKKYNHRQFSLRQCAEESLGQGWEAKLTRFAAKRRCFEELTFESVEAVDVSAFAAVTGSVMVERVEEGYRSAMASVDNLLGSWPTPNNLDVMTVAYSGKADGKSTDLAPLQPYPKTGLTPYKITLPAPVKHGEIVQVSLEAVKADRTGELIRGAREVGNTVGLEDKKRKLRVLLGITNNYKRNGTSYNTYLTSGAWINALDDFDQGNGPEEFDRLYNLMAQMTDPVTGEIIEVDMSSLQLLVPFSNVTRTRKNVSTTEIRDTVSSKQIITGNPMQLPEPVTDLQIRKLLTDAAALGGAAHSSTIAASYAIFGDTQGAFVTREVEPFTVLERTGEVESEAGWEQDVVYAAKARFWNVPCVVDPYRVYRGRKTS